MENKNDTMKNSCRLYRKSDGKYLFVKWYLTTVIEFSFVDKNEATIFNPPINNDPLDLCLLRSKGLHFFFLESGIHTKDLVKEDCEFVEEKLFDNEDLESINQFANFFNTGQ